MKKKTSKRGVQGGISKNVGGRKIEETLKLLGGWEEGVLYGASLSICGWGKRSGDLKSGGDWEVVRSCMLYSYALCGWGDMYIVYCSVVMDAKVKSRWCVFYLILQWSEDNSTAPVGGGGGLFLGVVVVTKMKTKRRFVETLIVRDL